jgi:hypothetical protein
MAAGSGARPERQEAGQKAPTILRTLAIVEYLEPCGPVPLTSFAAMIKSFFAALTPSTFSAIPVAFSATFAERADTHLLATNRGVATFSEYNS